MQNSVKMNNRDNIFPSHVVDHLLLPNSYNEYFHSNGKIRASVKPYFDFFSAISSSEYQHLHTQAIKVFNKLGVTFGLNKTDNAHIFPFDLIPRIIQQTVWSKIEKGLKQRNKALNLFLYDIYHKKQIIKNKVMPLEMIESSDYYLSQCEGIAPIQNTYIHLSGNDLIRDANGNYLVLEDNLRIPSGASYTLTNRQAMEKLFPNISSKFSIQPIQQYPKTLSSILCEMIDMDKDDIAVVLTPGPFNPAYYEHLFLAKKMGWPLVQGTDLFVENNQVYLKSKKSPKRVRVIYRRIEDKYLDPKMFYKKSLLGTPDLMRAYFAKNVVIANALGNGVADDKAIFAYVPKMIKYYLNEDPILPQVETYLCSDKKHKQKVLKNIDQLVIKLVNQSGGTGLLIGPQASKNELKACQDRIKKYPRQFIAQPLIELSSCPTWHSNTMVPRRIDLRPYLISGKTDYLMPGGLTRVALPENSYIVNSCQGGGSKDTWIVS